MMNIKTRIRGHELQNDLLDALELAHKRLQKELIVRNDEHFNRPDYLFRPIPKENKRIEKAAILIDIIRDDLEKSLKKWKQEKCKAKKTADGQKHQLSLIPGQKATG